MKNSAPSAFLDVAKAEDVSDLLEHIAWTDVLRPELLRQRDTLTKLLVEATLGRPVQVNGAQGLVTISREQLAGKVYGIDYIMSTFESILAKGSRGVTELRRQGVTLANGVSTDFSR